MDSSATSPQPTEEVPLGAVAHSTLSSQGQFSFGRFTAVPSARTLLRDGIPVDIGARAFDLLIILLRSRGRVVAKQAIVSHVWPTTTVDESNLRFQMTVLRKALGPSRELIKTIPGRGYLLAIDAGEDAPDDDRPVPIEPFRADSLESQRLVCDAFCTLLLAFGPRPDTVASLKALLSARLSGLAGRPQLAEPTG